MIVLIFGLPGSGKTVLANEIVSRSNAIHINGDDVRTDLSADLGFSSEDRLEQARRIGAVARLISSQGRLVVVDFVCPTAETRKAFGKADCRVWVDRIKSGRYEDTNKMWEDPRNEEYDLKINAGVSVEQEGDFFFEKTGIASWKAPTTLMLGRYQPWHEGHRALYEEAKTRGNQVVIGVRGTGGTSSKDPLEFEAVKQYILEDVPDAFVAMMPNITHIVYGRDVGYKIEKVELGQEIEAISATQKRAEMGI
jgi:hypothetical protein